MQSPYLINVEEPRRRHWLRWLLAGLGVVVLLIVLNIYLIDHQTKPAKANIGRIVNLPGGDLQVREDGRFGRPTLVLLHGWTGSMQWWDRVVPLLSRRYHIVRVDLLGHGGSQKPGSGYSIENQAKLVSEALDRIGVRSATVVGHSMGGVISTQLALTRPDLVRRLVLIDAPPAEKYTHTAFLTQVSLAPVSGELAKRFATDGTIRHGFQQAFTPNFKVPDDFIQQLKGMTYTSYRDSHQNTVTYLDRDGGLRTRLTRAHKPTLVIWGLKDVLVTPDALNEFRGLARTKILRFPNVGHSPMVEAPAKTAQTIQSFVSSRSR